MLTTVFVRDLDIAAHARLDRRRLEVVADGLWRGAQSAIDTTLVPLLHQDGSAQSRTHTTNGAALEKVLLRTYPELAGEGGRARLVVFVAEVGHRSSGEIAQFLQGLAKARAVCTVDPSRACGSRMDPTLELHLGLQRSACIHDVPVGAPTNPWHGKRGPL